MWPNVFTMALGLWVIAAPAVLGYGDPAQTNDHIIGPLVAAFALIACWPVTRGLRWLNLLLGAWLVVAPWLLGYAEASATINSMLAGALIALLSLIKGERKKRIGGGWAELFRR